MQPIMIPAASLLLWSAFVTLAPGADEEGPTSCPCGRHGEEAPDSPGRRIRYYEGRLRDDPEHYPSAALLGIALLDRARFTGDPADVTAARSALERSMAIQPTYEAMRGLAELCCFSHRFEEAIGWAERAAAASPEDTASIALRVEALLAMGRGEEARALLPSGDSPPEDYHLAAALGHCLMAEGRGKEARDAFRAAATAAREAGAPRLQVWALVVAAGTLIDTGRAADAVPLLDEAAQIDETDPLLRAHRAEVLEAEGRTAEALQGYEGLLKCLDDPAIHHRAYLLARQLGDPDRAKAHFKASEHPLLLSVEAGEPYGLEGLARLYFDAGDRRADALDLARRNLRYKRDREAMELVREIEAAMP